jgi:membrane-bound serine protease (ClpP class)
VLLFAAGLAFLMLEIFVLPGFGVFGLGGGVMILASLVLASLTFVSPHSDTEMAEMAQSGVACLTGVCHL